MHPREIQRLIPGAGPEPFTGRAIDAMQPSIIGGVTITFEPDTITRGSVHSLGCRMVLISV